MGSFFDFLHSTKTQAILAYIIIIGGLCIIAFCGLPENDRNRLFDIILLTATFYFGSSKSGANKDETIAAMAANPPANIVAPDNSGTIKT